MGTYRLNCVVDANVLIDLRSGGIVTEFFRLPLRASVPDVILAEMLDGRQVDFLEQGLIEHEFSGKQVKEVHQLRSVQRNISVNDMFAFVLARDTRATLLTGDGNLRRFARQQMVNVHGMLWVLDELVRLNVIIKPAAAIALEKMLRDGARLPREECESRLIRWRSIRTSGEALRPSL